MILCKKETNIEQLRYPGIHFFRVSGPLQLSGIFSTHHRQGAILPYRLSQEGVDQRLASKHTRRYDQVSEVSPGKDRLNASSERCGIY